MAKRPSRDPAKHSKKDPARPTRAKASRPDMPVLDDSLADLLNPGIGKGRAGIGSQTGSPSPHGGGDAQASKLAPPPDNSWDRRADFANAHRARKSTQQAFAERPQAGYAAKGPADLDPELAKALGYGGGDPSKPLIGGTDDETADEPAVPDRDEISDISEPRREKRHRPALQPVTLGVTASMHALENLLREGRPEFRENPWAPHRPPRPDKSEGGRALVIKSDFEPKGDQPQAIAGLVEGVQRHDRTQVLLGVTGSGKTFTMAKVIEQTQRPALILAPNKTLAAQLYGEFKNFFPDNAVEYFVSYYDYYQPEAYIPRTDTYIEKDSSINEQIDRMRHAATRALLERDDVIIVASVSCIYGIGSVETYSAMTFAIKRGERLNQRQLLADLVALQYKRTAGDFYRGSFRVRGDVIEIFPAHYEDRAWRVSLFGDEVEIDPRIRSAHRAEDRRTGIRQNLRQLALRHAAADAVTGDFRHQERTEAAARAAQRRRPAPRSAAARAAHAVRSGNDGGDRRLRGDRELLALSDREETRRTAADLVRIRARQCAGVCR